MRKYLIAVLISFSPLAWTDVGVGVILGSPTGVSAKFGLSSENAIDLAMAWDLSDDHFHIHSDYLFIGSPALDLQKFKLDWYYGIGGRLVILDDNDNNRNNRNDDDDDYKLGVRAPIGVNYLFDRPNVEVFAEIAVTLNLLESTDVDIDAGIGARFHF